MNGKLLTLLVSFTTFLALGALVVYALSGRSSLAGALPLDQNGAVSRAVEEARALGLKGEPRAVTAKRMTLDQYNKLTGTESGPAAAQYGLDPSQQVWVVGIKGQVEWAGPGRTSGMCPNCTGSDTFDNVTIVLSEASGEKLGSYAAGPGQPMPVGGGQESLDGGAQPSAPQPTAAPEQGVALP